MHPEDGMGWSWTELRATPLIVRQYCMDFLQVRAQARNRG